MLERSPVCHLTIGEICQLLNTVRIIPVENSGVRATTETLTTCRRSEAQ
jgi:hypothetical protein